LSKRKFLFLSVLNNKQNLAPTIVYQIWLDLFRWELYVVEIKSGGFFNFHLKSWWQIVEIHPEFGTVGRKNPTPQFHLSP
jgi:hypothetical protein